MAFVQNYNVPEENYDPKTQKNQDVFLTYQGIFLELYDVCSKL